jgi:hypothetical protein
LRAVVRLLIIVGLAAGWSGCGSDPPRDHTPKNQAVLDWRQGTYDEIALRTKKGDVVRRLGSPVRRGRNEALEPVGQEFDQIGGPDTFDEPRPERDGTEEVLRYRDRVVLVDYRGVYGWVTTSPRAQTPEGVGVGDALGLVSKRFPGAECDDGKGAEHETAAVCDVWLCLANRRLVFGGDPIRSVWLLALTAEGLRHCRGGRRVSPRPDNV